MADLNATTMDSLMVTASGMEEMLAEIEERKQKQIEIAKEIDEARRLGDLKENAPYQEAMQKKEINDARLEELEYKASIAQVVESGDNGIVGVGSVVEIESVKNSRTKTVTLVGRQAAQEADPREGKVSIDSPIGSALMGKKKGDEVEVDLPIGAVTYRIKKVA